MSKGVELINSEIIKQVLNIESDLLDWHQNTAMEVCKGKQYKPVYVNPNIKPP